MLSRVVPLRNKGPATTGTPGPSTLPRTPRLPCHESGSRPVRCPSTTSGPATGNTHTTGVSVHWATHTAIHHPLHHHHPPRPSYHQPRPHQAEAIHPFTHPSIRCAQLSIPPRRAPPARLVAASVPSSASLPEHRPAVPSPIALPYRPPQSPSSEANQDGLIR